MKCICGYEGGTGTRAGIASRQGHWEEGTMETKETKLNQEFLDLIDDLTDRKFFGEVTFYFQGGNIESSRQSERNSKGEIKERMAAKKRKRPIVTVRKSSGASG
jgi:hypothetical protein